MISGVPSVLDKLRELGKKIFFVTNNSTKSRKGYLGKFKSLGLEVNPEGDSTPCIHRMSDIHSLTV